MAPSKSCGLLGAISDIIATKKHKPREGQIYPFIFH
jgi:hypothetical protein